MVKYEKEAHQKFIYGAMNEQVFPHVLITSDPVVIVDALEDVSNKKIVEGELIDKNEIEKQQEQRTERTHIETLWRDTELTKVLNRIDQYEKDQGYPPELRTSPIQNEEDFLRLLKDRKLLSDYPQCEGFPFGARPSLSGVAT
ncbi:hypothetical protein MHO82_21175 [Vibrio sp. Of7-15]|uniref:hypothetical protein n=1 Tax=Vibrio sp. Of7-15 TaxID=2724879 RepID=UPI001EF34D34|nr:hypothetical protein [Vibrio sp. Of7-15]MCG7499382.1 hypothetical protein [Vibrio sp. Of7-15]